VFVVRNGRSDLTSVILTPDQVAERILSPTSRRIDLSTPFVEGPRYLNHDVGDNSDEHGM
jgi:hypothetical protein